MSDKLLDITVPGCSCPDNEFRREQDVAGDVIIKRRKCSGVQTDRTAPHSRKNPNETSASKILGFPGIPLNFGFS